jgi:hypothetical protein
VGARRYDARAAEAGLERLKPEHRAVLVLRDVRELDYDAIGAALDLPPRATVKSRISACARSGPGSRRRRRRPRGSRRRRGSSRRRSPTAVVEAPDAGVSVERWAARPLAAPEAWGAEPLADVFAAAPHLGSGRLVVCARSGSAQTTETLMDGLAGQSIGTAHSFGVGGPLDDSALASIGMPEPEAPAIASADGGPARAVLPLRRGWRARVRRSPAALAALRKTLEDAGMSVEFRLLPPSYPALERDADPTPDSVLWWSRPPGSWDRSVAVPVVIDSLPG